jgi:hypothetical protein
MKLTIRQIDNILRLCTLNGEPIEGERGMEIKTGSDGVTTATVELFLYANDGAKMGPFARKDSEA